MWTPLDWPAEAERLALADAEDEGDGPACGVAMSLGGFEDSVRFFTPFVVSRPGDRGGLLPCQYDDTYERLSWVSTAAACPTI